MHEYNKLFPGIALLTIFCFTSLCFAESYDLKLAALELNSGILDSHETNSLCVQDANPEQVTDLQIINIWKSEINHNKKRVKTGKIMVLGAGAMNLASPFVVAVTNDDDDGGEPELATFVYINLATIPVWILGLNQWIGGARKVNKLEKMGQEKGWNLDE